MKSLRSYFYQAASKALTTLASMDMLPWAAAEGRADTVRLLLAAGGDNVYGYTTNDRSGGSFRRIDQALWRAAKRGHTEVVELLTKAPGGPDSNACRHGLFLAEGCHHSETAGVLKRVLEDAAGHVKIRARTACDDPPLGLGRLPGGYGRELA